MRRGAVTLPYTMEPPKDLRRLFGGSTPWKQVLGGRCRDCKRPERDWIDMQKKCKKCKNQKKCVEYFLVLSIIYQCYRVKLSVPITTHVPETFFWWSQCRHSVEKVAKYVHFCAKCALMCKILNFHIWSHNRNFLVIYGRHTVC